MRERVCKLAAAAVGAAAGFFGNWPAALTGLAAVMSIDFVTGLIVAARGRSPKTSGGGLSSAAGFDGLVRKGMIMVVVLLATVLDRMIGSASMVFQTASAFYYIANESLSILENVALMGVKIPAFLRRALEVMRDRADEGESEPWRAAQEDDSEKT